MPKREKFPLAIKSGSSAVKIYRDRDYYRVAFYLGGKRQRLIFRDLDKAKNEAAAKAAQLARGDVDAAQLTGKDRLTYGRKLDAIRALGIPLDAAGPGGTLSGRGSSLLYAPPQARHRGQAT
jgi:hypothetical protein